MEIEYLAPCAGRLTSQASKSDVRIDMDKTWIDNIYALGYVT
jgi:hypothetical protein